MTAMSWIAVTSIYVSDEGKSGRKSNSNTVRVMLVK